MKRIVFIMVFHIVVAVQGQGFSLPTDYIRNNIQGNNIKWEKVEGSPYQYEEFREGSLQINEVKYAVSLRYNVYEDEIQINDGSNGVSNVLKRADIKINIGNDRLGIYQFSLRNEIKQGYFLELTDSLDDNHVILLKKLKRTFIEASEATSSYKKSTPPRIIEEYNYYLKLSAKPARLIKFNKRSILSIIEMNETKMKSYLSKNRNKLRKESEVVDFINYLNSI